MKEDKGRDHEDQPGGHDHQPSQLDRNGLTSTGGGGVEMFIKSNKSDVNI